MVPTTRRNGCSDSAECRNLSPDTPVRSGSITPEHAPCIPPRTPVDPARIRPQISGKEPGLYEHSRGISTTPAGAGAALDNPMTPHRISLLRLRMEFPAVAPAAVDAALEAARAQLRPSLADSLMEMAELLARQRIVASYRRPGALMLPTWANNQLGRSAAAASSSSQVVDSLPIAPAAGTSRGEAPLRAATTAAALASPPTMRTT